MNEQRTQAYVNLIEQLLTSADGEEPNILQANQELIDPEFLQVMENYATWLEEQGNNDAAAWFRYMAQQLGQFLNPQARSIEEYQGFLLEVLRAEAESNDPAVVYPILQRCQHLLDDTFAQLLQQYARYSFSQGKAEEVVGIAEVIQNLCIDISQFPLGSRANNLEIAITGYQTLLEVYTRQAFPYEWARSQNNLGIAYSDRIRGERADNLELAIAAYHLSLEVYTREAFPEQWATIQTNLGAAYQTRILGERADNLELAIAAYNLSLEVYIRDAFPYEWARSQNNLGNAYNDRILGERADNLELAIAALNQSLEVYTCDAFPYEWATTQNNLGGAYNNRIREERADNLELAIAALNLSLKIRTREAFPYEWATTQINLGNAYNDRILGERADNLELAIAAYNLSLQVYTREAFPYEWAMTQNNLGNAYGNRIFGERAENLELAIAAYNLSLEVLTRGSFPEKWANTQNNLGNAYQIRIRGEKADNLELAIVALNLSLEVYTRDSFPEAWAMTQTNLGNTYSDRIRGEKAENLELAIVAFNLSLEVRTRDSFPKDWANTQNNLGIAYCERIRGERADNLELAIAAYNLSLEVYTRDSFPYQWATTHNNLGEAYRNRIRGERADNLELTIVAYNLSLEVYTRDAFPYEWANTQNNLGAAYSYRIRGERADNLELAIAALNQSLEVYTRDSFPSEWARSQNNLGIAYCERIRGERADNLELAIAALKQSLEVYTREAFPEYWARSQNNLGLAYINRIRGERTDNIELAIVAYNLSLEVSTPTAFPIDCLRTGRNLGNTANFIKDWETAIKGYNLAIEAVENTRLQALNPQRQQEILSDAMDVYHGIVQSYLNLNQPDRALEYVERSKTRYLVQLLTDRDIYPKGNIPQTIITELDRLRRAIIGEEQRLAIQEQTRNQGVILTPDQQKQPILNDYTHLNHLKQELKQFIDREITPTDRSFSLTQKVETITLSEIQSLIDQDTAILEWYISGDSIMAFIVIPPNPPSKGGDFDSEVKGVKVWQSSAEDREKLINFIKNYRDAYENNKTEWINNLNDCLNQLSEILPIDELLELIPKSCSRLILIPHWFLHIIPLHCLPLKDGQFLYQRFSKGVGYLPSCQLLKLVKLSQRENFTRLFAIKNPTRKDLKPLLGANLEIERISKGFAAEKTIIIGELEASEQTLENRRQELQASHCLHFSCHGKFNNESPRDSALMLADPDGNLGELANLTLAEVFEKFDLRECRLVTFSACESGIIESKADSISDEYVGLPSGFLFAGSSSVVSTLWTVDPLATTLFMTKFYHDLKRISIQDQGSIAIVLNHTQTWLRTLNSKKLTRIKDSQKFQQLLDRVFENKRDRRKFQDLLEAAVKRQPYPFANPYYWTAFIATGV
ncbi:MAG: CHAT domain-containing protein [Microcystis sp. M54BS1]|uniref:CHAT domain-containing protein n=2 Tax=unclassified Microcystis TaxID=2643300 RepID=UPI003849982D|nr:CHAT domain-containing protein [Microcystis sp. M62BS1]MCA2510379.1 CHAT domain-containing protein [Microcystis sp. M60BS1]MCA2514656.1 CHAT domain-containing protein [Microcystis sp. M59BS1]MCA2519064.1 CHAT domain-containing protein [Microcystis sp. M63BS1]MCA2526085.1 CHAT domain-containing protein [Microcystis sp. M61BS1]MCA2529235.1 CHAT domain-containing protein [Microcystis sp. M51BS1]MCA2534111.1 CHAT domain-containing protein [Microcystis sp. M57BS1]MCA2540243.1 CHAT domain-conta